MREEVGKPARRVLVALAVVTATLPSALSAQEGAAECSRLNIAAAQKGITPAGIDLFWGNFRAECGDARMSSDSAFVRERFGVLSRARLIRNVRYQDSTRSLTSDSLTYSGADDRVVAMGNVVLTMRKSGARLSAPRVEFHRLTRSGAERTIATGRPQLIMEGAAGSESPPTTIDADRMEIFREDNAWYWGDVVIRRPDAVSYADSSFFDMVNETGVLHGGARMDGEDFELSGDSIRLELAGEALRGVHAFHGATATGEDFNIAAEEVRVEFADGEVEEVVAFGSRSAALSEGYHLLGDSLRFRLREGAMDSTFAIGSAVALEDTTAGLGTEPALSVSGDAGWLAGDTIVASFRRLAPPDSVAAQPRPDAPEADAVAAGDAVALGDEAAAVPDSAAPDGDAAGVAEDVVATDTANLETAASPEDTPRSELEQIRTIGNARAFYVDLDTTKAGPPARNYMIGEQIAIFFEDGRPVRVAAEQAIGVYLDPDPNAVVDGPPAGRTDSLPAPAQPGPGEAGAVEGDSAGHVEPTVDEGARDVEPTEGDGAGEEQPAKPLAPLRGESP